MAKAKVYRALVGINYPNPAFDPEDEESEESPELQVDKGDKIEGVPDDWARVQSNQGNIEKWRSGKTENVKDQSDYTVAGVSSRHANDGADIVLREVSK